MVFNKSHRHTYQYAANEDYRYIQNFYELSRNAIVLV